MVAVGQYELVRQVASSSTGGLWQAIDPAHGRDVALKQVSADASDAVTRLRASASQLIGISHPNIVAIFDIIDADDAVWLVEEWVPGGALPAISARAGRLSPQQALGVTRDVLLGLIYAHQLRIMHGNLTPANILLDGNGVAKLADFGLAAPTGMPGVSGTPGYMSLEVAAGHRITPRDDAYSAAVVLGGLLRGQALFDGPTPEAILTRQQIYPRPDLAGVEMHVRAVITKAIAEHPADRYGDAAKMLIGLERAAELAYGSDWLSQASAADIVGAIG